MTTIFIVDFFESPIDQYWIDGNRRLRLSSMINNDHNFPPFFPPPPADDFMAEWQRQRLIFFDCGVTFDHHRSAMIKNYLRWSWINNDDDNLLMFIFGCLIVNAYDWSTLFYLSSNPWISAVPVSQLISMGTSLFTTLHTLGNFCWPKIISLSIDLTYGQILSKLNIFGYNYY